MLDCISAVTEGSTADITNFITYLMDLHKIPNFYQLIDFIITRAKEKKVQIKLKLGELSLYEGLCRTIHKTWYDKVFNKIITERNHCIEIKKLKKNVLIHEIAHAIEKETPSNLLEGFLIALEKDLSKTPLITVKQQIKSLLIEGIKPYPMDEKLPELFARYFELFTYTNEVSQVKGIYLQSLSNFFLSTEKWRTLVLMPYLDAQITPEVKKWSMERLQSKKLASTLPPIPSPNWRNKRPSLFSKDN